MRLGYSLEPDDELDGIWTREQLIQLDDRFVVAVEAAIRLGLENRASASACERPGAGDLVTGSRWQANATVGPACATVATTARIGEQSAQSTE